MWIFAVALLLGPLAWPAVPVLAAGSTIELLSWERTTPLYETFLHGKTAPGAVVSLYVNEREVGQATASETGEFLFTSVPLTDGENQVVLTARNPDGGRIDQRALTIKGGRFTDVIGTGLIEADLSFPRAGSEGGSASQSPSPVWKLSAAFFAEGVLEGAYELTAAYDSRDALSRWGDSLRDSGDPSGDAASVESLAASQDRAYLSVEWERNEFLWGDYSTLLGGGELSAYNRALTGAKLAWSKEVSPGVWSLGAFAAQAPSLPVTESLPGQGISGFYHLSQAPVVPGTETVTIVALDPDAPGQPVWTDPKVRDADYHINYDSGALLFKSPVPRHDAELRPVFIAVTYEAASGNGSTARGGRLQYQSKDGWVVGTTSVTQQGSQPFQLLSGDVTLPVWPGAQLVFETGQSSQRDALGQALQGAALRLRLSSVPSTANAGGAETPDAAGASRDWEIAYKETDGAFSVTPGMATGIGMTEASAAKGFTLAGAESRLSLSVQEEANPDINHYRITKSAGIRSTKDWGRLTLTTRAQVRESASGGAAEGRLRTHRYGAGLTYRATDRLDVRLERERVVQSGQGDLAPAATHGGTSAVVAAYRLSDQTQGELSFYQADDGASAAALGLSHTLAAGDSGKASAHSKYMIEGTATGLVARASVGVDARYRVARDHWIDVGYERSEPSALGLGQATSPFLPPPPSQSSVVAWEYLPEELPFRLSVKYEVAEGSGEVQRLARVAALGRLARGLSLSGEISGGSRGGPSGQRGRRLALVYRPDRWRRTAIVASVEFQDGDVRLLETDGSPQGAPWGRRTAREWSLDATTGVGSAIDLGLRLAERRLREWDGITDEVAVDTRLYGTRAGWRLNDDYSLLGQVRYLTQPKTRSEAWGYSVGVARDFGADRSVRLEVGYRLQETTLAGAPWNWRTGPFINLSKMF